MKSKEYQRFYWSSLAILLVLSAYPLVNGMRMAYLSIANGVLEPEQYAKYVVPYTAICIAALLFAVIQPLLFMMDERISRFSSLRWKGLKRASFPVTLAGAYVAFILVEQFFEKIQINTAGMTLVDPASLSADSVTTVPFAAVDAWQASLCIASPLTREQSAAYVSEDGFFYVMANNTYKIHYYLISIVLITMVCVLVYGIGRMLRRGDDSRKKPLLLQGMATGVLIAFCVFANTTAFFRQAEAIQTPLASILTCLFFVISGVAAGVYAGSFLLGKGKRLGLGLPVLLSVAFVAFLYIGEAAMMEGGLYRFGTGWFFEGFPGISPAPVDMLVILFSGAATWLVLHLARQGGRWPDKRTAAITALLCVLLAGTGIIASLPQTQDGIASMLKSRSTGDAASKQEDKSNGNTTTKQLEEGESRDLYGCYEFDESIYMNPLSSTIAIKDQMPYVYGVEEDAMIIINTKTGDVQQLSVKYENTAVAEDEFSSKSPFDIFQGPNLSGYQERLLRAELTGEDGQHYGLYQMDNEIWLAHQGGEKVGVWSIYRLKRTDKFTFADLEYALNVQKTSEDKVQMKLRDVYELSRKGMDLAPDDFTAFRGKNAGAGFYIMRYEIEGGCVLMVHSDSPDASSINFARLSKRGYDSTDESLTVDIRDGEQAVAAYLDPLHSLAKLELEDPHSGQEGHELIYEFDGYRYFLNNTRADRIFVTFDNGERLPLKQALEERRTIIEDLAANGLYNIFMEPSENPMDGYFPILHHEHRFSFDGESFYPSPSFLYVTEDLSAYFDIVELADIIELYGREELAERLRGITDTSNLPVIAGKAYLKANGFAEAGITVKIGWEFSSHTPVSFTSSGK